MQENVYIYLDFCYFSCPKTLSNDSDLFFNFLIFFLI